MKKVLLSLILIAGLSAQFGANGIVALNTHATMFGGGVSYMFMEDGDLKTFGNFNFILGSKDDVDWTSIEFGSMSHYAFGKDGLYGIGGIMYHMTKQKFEKTIFGQKVSGESDQNKVAIAIGAGYQMDAIDLNAQYLIGGIEGLRIVVGFSF